MAGKIENLKPKTTPEARGKLGGIKSGQVRREKKLLSQIYAEALEKNAKSIDDAIAKLILRGDAATVSMLKEIGERTEGTKLVHSGDVENPVKIIINPVGE